MSTDLATVIANWSPQEKQHAFALLLREIAAQEPTANARSDYWSKLQARLTQGRATISSAEFLRELDQMD